MKKLCRKGRREDALDLKHELLTCFNFFFIIHQIVMDFGKFMLATGTVYDQKLST
jgi:hypothetical protein